MVVTKALVLFWTRICVHKGSIVWVTWLEGLLFNSLGVEKGQDMVERQ